MEAALVQCARAHAARIQYASVLFRQFLLISLVDACPGTTTFPSFVLPQFLAPPRACRAAATAHAHCPLIILWYVRVTPATLQPITATVSQSIPVFSLRTMEIAASTLSAPQKAPAVARALAWMALCQKVSQAETAPLSMDAQLTTAGAEATRTVL